jgi:hypothetical protein
MPTLSLRWIIGLLAAFVIAAGVHLYLTRTYGSRGGPEALRMDVTDFMAAARAGELTEGRIAFRTNATGLADLTARRTLPGSTATATTQTTARLTDGDLALLRERRFAETDAAALAEARAATGPDRATTFSRTAVQVLGLLLLVAGLLAGGQFFAARLTAFSPKTLRPAAPAPEATAAARNRSTIRR